MDEDIKLTFDSSNFIGSFQEMIQSVATFGYSLDEVASKGKETFTKIPEYGKTAIGKVADGAKKLATGSSGILGQMWAGLKIGFSGLLDKFSSGTKEVTEKGKEAVGGLTSYGVAKGMIMAQAIVGALKKGLAQIPEVGRAFSIAGSIISRNLLWPLRKELIPLLRGMLSWVRDHRAMFVRWGQIIANVFRVVKVIIIAVYETISKVVKQIFAGLEKIFGKSKNSVEQMLNILLFKIAAIAIFVQMTMEPVLNFIVRIVLRIVEAFKSMGDGITEVMGDVVPVLEQLGDIFQPVIDVLGSLGIEQSSVNDAFKKMGAIVGMTVLPVIIALVAAFDLLVNGLAEVVDGYKMMSAAMSGDYNKVIDIDDKSKERWDAFKKREAMRQQAISSAFSKGGRILSGEDKPVEKTSVDNKQSSIQQKTVNNNMANTWNIKIEKDMTDSDMNRTFTGIVKEQQRQLGRQGA